MAHNIELTGVRLRKFNTQAAINGEIVRTPETNFAVHETPEPLPLEAATIDYIDEWFSPKMLETVRGITAPAKIKFDVNVVDVTLKLGEGRYLTMPTHLFVGFEGTFVDDCSERQRIAGPLFHSCLHTILKFGRNHFSEEAIAFLLFNSLSGLFSHPEFQREYNGGCVVSFKDHWKDKPRDSSRTLMTFERLLDAKLVQEPVGGRLFYFLPQQAADNSLPPLDSQNAFWNVFVPLTTAWQANVDQIPPDSLSKIVKSSMRTWGAMNKALGEDTLKTVGLAPDVKERLSILLMTDPNACLK